MRVFSRQTTRINDDAHRDILIVAVFSIGVEGVGGGATSFSVGSVAHPKIDIVVARIKEWHCAISDKSVHKVLMDHSSRALTLCSG